MGLFSDRTCDLVGMVHLQPLPGSSGWAGDMDLIEQAALRDASLLVEGGCDALIVENMGDTPYLKGRVYPETVAAMSRIVTQVVGLGIPTGVQILAGANVEALGVAVASGAHFIRVEGFAYGHLADEGWIEACAGELLRERSRLRSETAVWADVQKKHASHAMTADLSLTELGHGHAFCGADVLIATGQRTGGRTRVEDVKSLREAGLPVVVGSGVDVADASELAKWADALIVGSALKEGGDWRRPVELERVRALSDTVRAVELPDRKPSDLC